MTGHEEIGSCKTSGGRGVGEDPHRRMDPAGVGTVPVGPTTIAEGGTAAAVLEPSDSGTTDAANDLHHGHRSFTPPGHRSSHRGRHGLRPSRPPSSVEVPGSVVLPKTLCPGPTTHAGRRTVDTRVAPGRGPPTCRRKDHDTESDLPRACLTYGRPGRQGRSSARPRPSRGSTQSRVCRFRL